jgi:hypothetical protein
MAPKKVILSGQRCSKGGGGGGGGGGGEALFASGGGGERLIKDLGRQDKSALLQECVAWSFCGKKKYEPKDFE